MAAQQDPGEGEEDGEGEGEVVDFTQGGDEFGEGYIASVSWTGRLIVRLDARVGRNLKQLTGNRGLLGC